MMLTKLIQRLVPNDACTSAAICRASFMQLLSSPLRVVIAPEESVSPVHMFFDQAFQLFAKCCFPSKILVLTL